MYKFDKNKGALIPKIKKFNVRTIITKYGTEDDYESMEQNKTSCSYRPKIKCCL